MSFEETLKEIVREVIREELKSFSADDPLLTAEQVAEMLAYTDVDSVYRLRREKKLRAIKISDNAIRFQRSDVRRFIEERAQ